MILKRVFDVAMSLIGLVLLFPIFIVIAIAIKIDSRGPVFFRQVRVGQYQKEFSIFKFRTMSHVQDGAGSLITVGNDVRISRVGRLLRKYKLDELAQLIDVLRGTMSLVGPRPEVPDYVKYYPSDAKSRVFSVKPGITDWASIEFKDENLLLEKAADPRDEYIQKIIPIKVKYFEAYVAERTFVIDLKIIYRTFLAIVKRN